MPILSYKKKFAPLVEAGAKRHTIRARRKDGKDPKAGQTLYQYTGLRTKGCRKLREDICTSSTPIQIDPDCVVVGGELLTEEQEEKLALGDGFTCLTDFREFFLEDHPKKGTVEEQFDGFLIKW